jgi:hypothetical protein
LAQTLKQKSNIESTLAEELRRIEERLGLSLGLKVRWIPDPTKPYSGEVRDGCIFIYEGNEQHAIQVLKHEILDYLLTSKIVKPLVDLINLLIKCKEGEIYAEKEKLADILSKPL